MGDFSANFWPDLYKESHSWNITAQTKLIQMGHCSLYPDAYARVTPSRRGGHVTAVEFCLKQITAEWTSGIVACAKPFVQTGRVELFLASLAAQLGKRVVTAMNHGKTYHAFIYALETFVHVPFPQNKSIHDTAILKRYKTTVKLHHWYSQRIRKEGLLGNSSSSEGEFSKEKRHVRLLLVHNLT